MKEIILMIFVAILSIMLIRVNYIENRYSIIIGDYGVILLDKQTGLTWRQISVDKNGPAAYWEEMLFYGDLDMNVPIGKEQQKKRITKKIEIEV